MSEIRYIRTEIKNWSQIYTLNPFFISAYIFRGQANSEWNLKSSIERKSDEFGKTSGVAGFNTEEKWMLHEFKRKFHLYSKNVIDKNDKFEWLAIMQHYGAPTRLLDFTQSIYIATYFAIIDSTAESSIWAVNKHILRDNLLEKQNLPYKKRMALKDEINIHHTNFANKFIACEYSDDFGKIATIIPLDSKACSERLARQQGYFLMPTSPKETFEKNLELAFDKTNSEFEHLSFEDFKELTYQKKSDSQIGVFKIDIPKSLKRDLIKMLKEMNVTSEILFPGLEGLAKSLFQSQII